MNEFLQHLKERKLVQWAVAYVAAAFALLQGIDIIANRFDFPSQTVRLVMLAMIVGFFVTLVLAWYHGERGAQRMTGTELFILALLLMLGGGFLWRFAGTAQEGNAKLVTKPPPPNELSAPVSRKSIAVLPFENRSASGEDAEFLAAGIHEDLINTLSRVPGLKGDVADLGAKIPRFQDAPVRCRNRAQSRQSGGGRAATGGRPRAGKRAADSRGG
jgi:hypothetical protein